MRQVLLLIILFSQIVCFGQMIENDVIVKTYAVPDSIKKRVTNYNITDISANAYYIPSTNQLQNPISEYESLKNLAQINLSNVYACPGSTIIHLWNKAQFIATGDVRDFPGLMHIHSGTIGINQNIGKFSFYAGAVANKYGYFNGLSTQYGLAGKIHGQFTSNLSFTAFGTYYFGRPNGFPMIPAMVGNYGVSTFGGYMSYQFNSTFGVDVGAQTVQQFGTNKYYVEPIVTPTVKVGKVRIGLPVGQILHGIIRSQAEQRNLRK